LTGLEIRGLRYTLGGARSVCVALWQRLATTSEPRLLWPV
jgi:hypothetical protein